MAPDSSSILLVLPVPFHRDPDGNLLVEKQAANGLERWGENFQHLVVACALQPDREITRQNTTTEYVRADQLPSLARIELVELPWAYKLSLFLKTYRQTRNLLADLIRRCDYLSFAISGLVGDWASVAALEAIRQQRPYSVWTDNVGHRLIRRSYLDQKGLRRPYYLLRDNVVVSPLLKRLERSIITRCDLGLFHGRDCFDAYSPLCGNPHLVHNIHLKPEDRLGLDALERKLARIRSGQPLRLVYVGRALGIKGPFDWLGVMSDLKSRGLRFQASWIGDGPALPEMRAEVGRQGLGSLVELPGYVGDRSQLLGAIRDADLFVFCHKILESPRCLIEALVSGAPIVGYASPYSRDLVDGLADRLLVERHDVPGLTETILRLDADRGELAETVRRCHDRGADFSDEAVFRHRSDLIKSYLGPGFRARSEHLDGRG